MNNNLKKTGAIVTLPFTFLPFLFTKKGLDGIITIYAGLGLVVYFAGAYGIQKATGRQGVMKTALVIWLIGSAIAWVYLAAQSAKDKPLATANPDYATKI